jgi:TPR repeat protein
MMREISEPKSRGGKARNPGRVCGQKNQRRVCGGMTPRPRLRPEKQAASAAHDSIRRVCGGMTRVMGLKPQGGDNFGSVRLHESPTPALWRGTRPKSDFRKKPASITEKNRVGRPLVRYFEVAAISLPPELSQNDAFDRTGRTRKKRLVIKFALAILAAVAWLALPLTPCFADSFSLAETRLKAELGVAEAQFFLGVMYRYGEGAPRDYAEAMKWWRKAAEQGDANAQFALGVMYLNGEGAPRDYAEAMSWFRKAAEQGDANAQVNLGAMYYGGEGVRRD